MFVLRKFTSFSLTIFTLILSSLVLCCCQQKPGTPLDITGPTPTRTRIVLPTILPSATPSATSAPTIVPKFTSQYTPAPGYVPEATETPLDGTPLWSSGPIEAYDQFFLVIQNNFFTYRAYLYDVNSGLLKERAIDLAETGWNLSIREAHYNPNSGEIILTVGRNVWDVDGGYATPPGAPPQSPFGFGVYKTDFSPQSDLEIVYQNDENVWDSQTVLNIHTNSLVIPRNSVMRIFSDSWKVEIGPEEIWELDLMSGEAKWLTNIAKSKLDRDIVKYSPFQISPYGDKAYQLLLYESRSEQKEYFLEVMALDIEDHSIQSKLLARGKENIWYDFYITNLKPDDLSYGILKPLKPPENAIAWSLTFRFAACRDGGHYYIYDTYEENIIETGIDDYINVFSAQWR